jgi:hypothetical protein
MLAKLLRLSLSASLLLGAGSPAALRAQHVHEHTPAILGAPQGVPLFCANPTAVTLRSGSWSDAAIWSNGRVPAAGEQVKLAAGHDITYDAMSDVPLDCIEVDGALRFSTTRSTRLKVANLTVLDEGRLEIGSVEHPVAGGVTTEIIVVDRLIDREIDPSQMGTGIQALGAVTMHGEVKTPTFVRLAAEPHAGDNSLSVEGTLSGWKPGDSIVIPDTRQLRLNERGTEYRPQDEKIAIAEVAGSRIQLASPLRFDHKGARDADGVLEFLPHIGNVSRSIVIRSERPTGTRGHIIYMSHANVDMRYVEVRDMGRTRMGVLDNSMFDAQGALLRFGENQIGRYAIHFHHDFGPKVTPANGYQFTLIGNAVDGAPKWGITVHNTHYGLVRDNVVYNTRGAGIVTEDGTESFNIFEHNFALRSEGSGDFAPRSGYGGPAPDPGGEGAGFWFRGPNNVIRDNVAANADAFGFGLAAGSLETVRIPAFKGADTSRLTETVALDTTAARVPEFRGNEAYGAMQAGVAWGWNGEIEGLRVWHASRHGLTLTPTDALVVDRVTIRGDKSLLDDGAERPAGVWVGNYRSKTIVVRNADVQGMRTGVSSPFYQEVRAPEPGRGDGSVLVEKGRFRNYIGVSVATAYSAYAESGAAVKKAEVRDSTFGPLAVPADRLTPPSAISMNYLMSPGDRDAREPIIVSHFNGSADSFKVYYSLDAPGSTAPCRDTRPGIDGWACQP